MIKFIKSCGLILAAAGLLWSVAALEPARAQWPPFTFRLAPSAENGRITYRITRLDSEVDWLVSDVQLRIALPAGLRFVEAAADPPVQTGFDGREVSFFFLNLDEPVTTAYFTVEVTDPTETIFTLQPWLSWKGQVPGEYVAEPISVDTSQPGRSVDWEEPARLPLQLEASAAVADQVITYKIYPQRTGRDRIWDLKIGLALPEGTTFLSAAAPPNFETGLEGSEVYFFTLEMPPAVEPLEVNLSAEGVITPVLSTRVSASWKNVSRRAVASMGAENQIVTGDILVQPQAAQYVVADQAGDVPLSEYDLTGISFQSSETMLEVTFQTAGQLCGSEQPLEFRLFIDADCRADTGEARRGIGADYDIRYDAARDKVWVGSWDASTARWPSVETAINHFVGRQTVTVQVPYSALNNSRQFCWAARGRSESQAGRPALPDDWLPGADPRLGQYRPAAPAPASLVSLAGSDAAGMLAPWGLCPAGQPAPSPAPGVTEPSGEIEVPPYITGRIAVPLYNSSTGGYNIHLFSLPRAQEIAQIPAASQPNFSADGQRLLFRRPGDNGGIYEYNFADGTEKLVSEKLNHRYPFYDPWGNRLVYESQELISGASDSARPFLLVQCSLLPPHSEAERGCQDIRQFGALLSAGSMVEITGSHPVWTITDMIAYSGCTSDGGGDRCGIYTVPSASTRRLQAGSAPRQLTDHPTDIPSDTKGNLIAFSSQRAGNWEAYIMNLDGTDLRDLSDRPLADDGLPAISPDGDWAAFVSNREGSWSVWVTSVDGRQTQKLFGLPAGQQLGINDQDWLNERLAWGP